MLDRFFDRLDKRMAPCSVWDFALNLTAQKTAHSHAHLVMLTTNASISKGAKRRMPAKGVPSTESPKKAWSRDAVSTS